MTPNPSAPTGVLDEKDREIDTNKLFAETPKLPPRKYVYVWFNIGVYIYLHVVSLYGLYLVFTSAKLQTVVHAFTMIYLGILSITCGAHRLWSHRSYKAKMPLKVLLLVLQTMTFQMSVINWARDHRMHHKYAETDADPHNAKRGLFYSHIGWLVTKRHREFFEKGNGLDMSDLTSDPMLRFQKKYYKYCMFFLAVFLPTLIPMIFWNESFTNASVLNITRYCISLHITWAVNSFAHWRGNKPYDKNIYSAQNVTVSWLTLGEGWHNYHHTFPWDYKTDEFGNYSTNLSTAFLDFMGKIGWAYDMKTVSPEHVKKRVMRTGDGSHPIWGWGDLSQEDRNQAIVINKKYE